MTDKQKEATQVSNRNRVYQKIKAVFDLLPERFKAGELEKLCGFKASPLHRMLVSSVLQHDFKCLQVGASNGCWKKTSNDQS
jgi:hypothetical protein